MQNSKPQLKTQSFLILVILFFLPVYLVKIKLGWVYFNSLELLIAILFVVWLSGKQKKYSILNTQYSIPALLILAGLIFSTLAAKNYYSGFGAIKGWFLFPIIFAAIFFDQLKRDDSLLNKALLTLFFSGAAVSALGVVYYFLGYLTYDGRLRIFWDSPNQLAMFLAVPFLIGVSRFEKAGLWRKLSINIGILLILINLYLTQSYGAWLGVLVFLAVFLRLKYGKIVQKKYAYGAIAVIIIFLALASYGKFDNIKNLGERSSLASRIMIWKSASLMIENNPLFGVGPNNFQNKYLEYQKYFPPYLEWSAPQPHNIFLAFWLESGFPGLIGFLWILYLFFQDNKKAINWDRNLGLLFLATMIYILIHGLVDTTYWRNDLAIVFWIIIAANIFLANSDKASS